MAVKRDQPLSNRPGLAAADQGPASQPEREKLDDLLRGGRRPTVARGGGPCSLRACGREATARPTVHLLRWDRPSYHPLCSMACSTAGIRSTQKGTTEMIDTDDMETRCDLEAAAENSRRR